MRIQQKKLGFLPLFALSFGFLFHQNLMVRCFFKESLLLELFIVFLCFIQELGLLACLLLVLILSCQYQCFRSGFWIWTSCFLLGHMFTWAVDLGFADHEYLRLWFTLHARKMSD